MIIQDFKAIGGVKSEAITSFTKGKCNSHIFSTQTTHKNVLPGRAALLGGLANGDFSLLTDGENTQNSLHLYNTLTVS